MKIQNVLFLVAAIVLLNFIALPSAASLPNAIMLKPGAAKDPVSKQEQMIRQMKWFIKLTPRDYEKLTGKKLNFFAKISFKLSQHRMKEMLKYRDEPTTLQKISWFAKGMLLGPIAVLLAYIFLKDDDRELIKWTWFGFATIVVVIGVLLLVM